MKLTRAKSVLYVRAAPEIHGAIRQIADLAGLSMSEVTEALCANAVGVENPYTSHLTRVINKWKRGQP